MLTRFPDEWKIIYVQPSFIGLFLKQPLSVLPRKVKNNILVVSFPFFTVLDRSPFSRRINEFLIVFWARFFNWVYNFKNPVLVIYEPRFSCVIDKLKECLVCYKVVDDRMEFTEVPRWIKSNIDFLIKKSDIIVTSSQHIFKKLSKIRNQNIFLVGNGAEVEHFKKATENIEIPADIASIKKPILGYIGAIGEWFDFQLIENILTFYPDISVVLIGPILSKQDIEINRLKKSHSNLFVLGKKPYDFLPNYIKAFDACIIPFKINELTLGVNPNKLYEYLAAEKPTISTALPEVMRYNGTVYVAGNYEEFLYHINKALNSKHDLDKFFGIANENTWDEKAKTVVNLILKYKRKVCE